VPGGAYVHFPFRFFAAEPSGFFPDEDYFRVLGPERGETVLDVGACVGFSASVAARMVGEKGLVVTVEPDPDNLEVAEAEPRALPELRGGPEGGDGQGGPVAPLPGPSKSKGTYYLVFARGGRASKLRSPP
jgi:hypothetical protein